MNCPKIKQKSEELKALKQQFEEEFANFRRDRNARDVFDIKKQIEEELIDIKSQEGMESLNNKLSGDITKQIKTAKEIMDQGLEQGKTDCLGPVEIKKAFGIELDYKDIPKIPFSRAELIRAKELNQFLVYRAPLTMKGVRDALLANGYDEEKQGKITISESYDKKFWEDDPIEPSWALATKDIIENSTRKDYLEQTEIIITYLKDKVFSNQSIPDEYREVFKQFEEQKDEIRELITSDWEKAAEVLENLKITDLTRHTPAEALYVNP